MQGVSCPLQPLTSDSICTFAKLIDCYVCGFDHVVSDRVMLYDIHGNMSFTAVLQHILEGSLYPQCLKFGGKTVDGEHFWSLQLPP